MFKFSPDERWLTPFSFTMIVASLFYGLILIVSASYGSWEPSPATVDAPPLFHLLEGIVIAVGSAFILMAEREWKTLNTSWALGKAGSLLLFWGYIADAAIVFFQDWTHTASLLVSLTMAVAIATRYVQVTDRERRIREKVKTLWKLGLPRKQSRES